MPNTCSVPNCKGNYRSGVKVPVFSFPKNEELRRKWVIAIRRNDFTPTKNARVSIHFSTVVCTCHSNVFAYYIHKCRVLLVTLLL